MSRRAVPWLLSCLLIAAWSLGAWAADDPNWKRLEAMPRDQRVSLSRNLDRYDALSQDERSAIRTLDAEIAKLDPLVQARYQTLLRRYHVWLSGLTDAQKTQLAQAGSVDSKLALIDKWRKAERLANSRSRSLLPLGVYPGDLGTMPPFEMANALRAWFMLDDMERRKIESIEPIRQRIIGLIARGAEKGVTRRRFPAAEEDALMKRIETNDLAKQIFPNYYRKMEKAEAKRPGTFGPLHHLTESLYFIDHPSEPVSLARLVQFEGELPPWFRASLDPLPPEDAKRRLTILYRQIYQYPAEIPPPKKAVAKPSEKPKAVGPKSGGTATPF
jgi:hypothetical protein